MSVESKDRAPVAIGADVEFLEQQIEALNALGGNGSVDDGELYDVSVRWGTALAGRLPRLLHYSSLGRLDDADQHRFQLLCEELRRVSDLADTLGLPRPLLPGEEAAAARGHRHLRMRKRPPKRRS